MWMRGLFPFKSVVSYNPHGNKQVAIPITLGDKLRNRRLELGLSQSQVAKLFDTDSDLVYMWEKNFIKPTIKRFPQVINFLEYFPFETDRTTLGGRIKEYRYLHGLSQEVLALKLGINESTIFHYENGKHKPTLRVSKKLESFLDNNI